MKEKLYTIPLNDAVNAGDECPFCYIERNVEQDLMDFVLGSCASYMESDVREDTDREGFCRTHMKKMFDYGNTLGNGWILKTYYKKLLSEMDGEFRHFRPQKQSMGDKLRKIAPKTPWQTGCRKRKAPAISATVSKKNTSAIWTLFSIYMKRPGFQSTDCEEQGLLPASFWGALQQRGYQTVGEGKRDLFPGNFRDHAEKYGAYERRCGLAD